MHSDFSDNVSVAYEGQESAADLALPTFGAPDVTVIQIDPVAKRERDQVVIDAICSMIREQCGQ